MAEGDIQPPSPPGTYLGGYVQPKSVTWMSALGGICLGIYLLTQGQIQEGIAAILAGLAAMGLRRAVSG